MINKGSWRQQNYENSTTTVTLFILFMSGMTLLINCPAYSQKPPRFEDYPAGSIYKGPVASVDLRSHKDATHFRTILRSKARGKPNFAGHYFGVAWGCGTDCVHLAIVDAKNGRVHFPLESAGISYEYKVDSKLIIVNPPQKMEKAYRSNRPSYSASRYYLWTGHAKLLYKEELPTESRK